MSFTKQATTSAPSLTKAVNRATGLTPEGLIDLSSYELIAQVQLKKSGGDYLVADQVYIRKTITGQYEVVVNEIKLSDGTPFTKRHNQFLNDLRNGNANFDLRNEKFNAQGNSPFIPQGTIFNVKAMAKTAGNGTDDGYPHLLSLIHKQTHGIKMNKKEVNEIVNRKLEPYFLEQGYVSSKPKSEIIFQYTKKDELYAYSGGGYLLKYDKDVLVYGFSFGINKIVEILREIDSHVKLQKFNPYNINDTFIGISPGVILFPRETSRAYKSFGDAFELELILNDIIVFHRDFFTTFTQKYNNAVALDKLYNRLDDFRTDEISFPSLSFLPVTRLIIARLAENPDYEKVVEKNFELLEYLWERDGGKYDRFDESNPEVFAAKYLRNLKL